MTEDQQLSTSPKPITKEKTEEIDRSGCDDGCGYNNEQSDMVKIKLGKDGEVVEEEKEQEEQEEEVTLLEKARKAAVAVSGGAMVVVGIPLIPFPAPFGVPLVAGGLTVLASEFPAAQRVLDNGKEQLRNFAEHEEGGAGGAEEEENQTDVQVAAEDDLGLGFEIVKDGNNNNDGGSGSGNGVNTHHHKNKANGPKESLRALTRNQILPMLDHFSSSKKKQQQQHREVSKNKDQGEEKSDDFYQRYIF